MSTRSQDFIRSAYAAQTDDVWLVLLTISHSDLSDDIRVVNNTEDVTSRSNLYVKFAFDLSLPIDSNERTPAAELRIDNVSSEIAQAVRSISTAPSVKIEIIRAAEPDSVELAMDGFFLRDVRWDVSTVSGTLVLDDIDTEPYPAGIFSPASFPGVV